MTPEAQRIAIAEACGWTNIHRSGPMNKLIGDQQGYKDGHGFSVLDYLSDLNAMHEAEKVLTDEQHIEFRCTLLGIVGEGRPFISASAAQRAEAFLRTLHLWT